MIWGQQPRHIRGAPLKWWNNEPGVYFTPFTGTSAASELRRYLRLKPEEVAKQHGLYLGGRRGHGEAVVLFSVHASDRLLKAPSDMKTGGREAIVGGHLHLEASARLALIAFDRRDGSYIGNDTAKTVLSAGGVARLLCEVRP